MTITELLNREDLDRSVLIGYYGGGNFGDELLLEVLMNLLTASGVKNLTVTYQHLARYGSYHHDFGYQIVDMAAKISVLKAVLANRSIVVGGGGLWGLDVNPNIFILSCLLFVSRFLLRKRVYLLGVGYYNSTSRLGHISAWLASKSANYIVARDQESVNNFENFSLHVSLDRDLAYQIPNLELESYEADFDDLDHKLTIAEPTVWIALRRFKPSQTNHYTELVAGAMVANPKTAFIVSLLEPRAVDPENYQLIQAWQSQYQHLQVLDFDYNPIALFLLWSRHAAELRLVAPQFHAIITAQLAGVAFLPIVYDNKVQQLLKTTTDAQPIPINDLGAGDLQTFVADVKRAAH